LLRSDGLAVFCGSNGNFQCDIPQWLSQALYVPDASLTSPARGIQVFQLSYSEDGDGYVLFTCTSMSGEDRCTVTLRENDLIMSVPGRIAKKISVPQQYLMFVLPKGDLLSSIPGSTRVDELVGIRCELRFPTSVLKVPADLKLPAGKHSQSLHHNATNVKSGGC